MLQPNKTSFQIKGEIFVDYSLTSIILDYSGTILQSVCAIIDKNFEYPSHPPLDVKRRVGYSKLPQTNGAFAMLQSVFFIYFRFEVLQTVSIDGPGFPG